MITLPPISSFVIPYFVISQNSALSIETIQLCMEKNGISVVILTAFNEFTSEQEINAEDGIIAWNEYKHGTLLCAQYPKAGPILREFIGKCMYELRVAPLQPFKITKQDENEF